MTVREFRRELKDWSGGLAYWASALSDVLDLAKSPEKHVQIKIYYAVNGEKYLTEEEALEAVKKAFNTVPENDSTLYHFMVSKHVARDFTEKALKLPVEEVLDISKFSARMATACLTKELLLKYFHKVETVSYSWEAKKETANASK